MAPPSERPAVPAEKSSGGGERTVPPVVHKATGIPMRRFTSVSLTDVPTVKPVVSLDEREAEQLTQERLEELWAQLLEKSKDDTKLYELLADKKVVLKNNNLFHIQVSNLRFDTLLHDYQDRILGFLREATHNESLRYKAVVVVDHDVKAIAYLPRDKFDAMAKKNPAILTLRKLFPNIDF